MAQNKSNLGMFHRVTNGLIFVAVPSGLNDKELLRCAGAIVGVVAGVAVWKSAKEQADGDKSAFGCVRLRLDG